MIATTTTIARVIDVAEREASGLTYPQLTDRLAECAWMEDHSPIARAYLFHFRRVLAHREAIGQAYADVNPSTVRAADVADRNAASMNAAQLAEMVDACAWMEADPAYASEYLERLRAIQAERATDLRTQH